MLTKWELLDQWVVEFVSEVLEWILCVHMFRKSMTVHCEIELGCNLLQAVAGMGMLKRKQFNVSNVPQPEIKPMSSWTMSS